MSEILQRFSMRIDVEAERDIASVEVYLRHGSRLRGWKYLGGVSGASDPESVARTFVQAIGMALDRMAEEGE